MGPKFLCSVGLHRWGVFEDVSIKKFERTTTRLGKLVEKCLIERKTQSRRCDHCGIIIERTISEEIIG